MVGYCGHSMSHHVSQPTSAEGHRLSQTPSKSYELEAATGFLGFEQVKDMALDQEESIVRAVMEEASQPGVSILTSCKCRDSSFEVPFFPSWYFACQQHHILPVARLEEP